MFQIRQARVHKADQRIQSLIAELRDLTVNEVDMTGRRNRLYGPHDQAALGHLDLDAERINDFCTILNDGLPDVRVLDLGANPYILTYALGRLGASVIAAGHPVPNFPGAHGAERVEFGQVDGREVLNVPLFRFNVESDNFPLDDASFDAVVCGELIEHLPDGPAHMLYECNRIFTSGGRLILSTPTGTMKWLIISMIQRIFASQDKRLPRLSEGLILGAVKTGNPRLYRPSWLFGAADSVPMIAGRPAQVSTVEVANEGKSVQTE